MSEMPRPMNCRECGRPLTDGMSRRFGYGPDCRSGMTGAELRAAADLVKEMAKPGYVPPDRSPTFSARATNAEARRTVEQAQAREVCERHGGLPGACPLCRWEEDPSNATVRVIAEIQAERLAVRDAAYFAARSKPVVLELPLEIS